MEHPMKGLTAFATALSSFLLFWLELSFAKMLLPYFGGGAQIWTACLAAFQLLLLLGYGYAWGITKLKPRTQLTIHSLFAIAALCTMPIHANFWQHSQLHPTLLILANILLLTGLPFGFLCTTSSIIQSWYVRAFGTSPYWLYAFSNLGSLAALIIYPSLLEPNFNLKVQIAAWSGGFAISVILTGLVIFKAHQRSMAQPEMPLDSGPPVPPTSSWRMLRWWVCAFVPSSLLSGLTAYVTAEISPNPMTWSIFLGQYLVSLILVFLPQPILPPRSIGNTIIVFIGAFLVLELNSKTYFDRDTLVANIAFFSILCWFCHGWLARSKPLADRLGQFYFVMVLGGASGALFNALIAPLLFARMTEYQIVLALASPLLLSISATDTKWQWLPPSIWRFYCKYLRLVVVLFFTGLSLLYAHPALSSPGNFQVERVARSFYASYLVAKNDQTRMLIHGRTLHGRESLDPHDQTPGTYYFPGGPIANVFDLMPENAHVAAIGLGVGEIVAYAKPQQTWKFYEIDPLVVDIAQTNFSHLAKAPKSPEIVIGDGRLQMQASSDTADLIVIDAFNSDAIPVHLLTQESLADVFLPHLAHDGVIAYHITNTFLDLEPILDRLAQQFNLSALTRSVPSNDAQQHAQSANQWVVISRNYQLLALLQAQDWQPLKPGNVLWTDDFSSVRAAMHKAKPA
jgi:spermidine synthase